PRASLAKEASERRAGRIWTYVQAPRAQDPDASGVRRRRSRAPPGESLRRRGATMTALLELEDVHARYGETRALHGVSFAVEEGSSLALLGANGAGKTTTLRAISSLVRKTGHIAFAGRSIARRSPEAIARLGIAHVPQGRGIIADLTVDENLRLG